MWIHSWTNLGGSTLNRNPHPPSPSPVHSTKNAVVGVLENCRMCWTSCVWMLCDTCERDIKRGGYPDYFRWQSAIKKYFLDSPLFLRGWNYHQSHSVLGLEHRENSEVYLQWIEKYDDFLVCIVNINRQIPWIHKGRKLWPDWKRDGEETLTPKMSYKAETYRVAFDPKNLSEKEMVVYSWVQRNGKLIPDTEINYSSLLKIMGKIIEVMKI